MPWPGGMFFVFFFLGGGDFLRATKWSPKGPFKMALGSYDSPLGSPSNPGPQTLNCQVFDPSNSPSSN